MSSLPFHPVIASWFSRKFAAPTEPQERGWPEIALGRHTLIAAPTGSGKTLTAFLAVIDRLFREAVNGTLKPELRVVYVSPLRALSNDMQRNLESPLAEISAEAVAQGLTIDPVRVGLRTGDTPQHQRQALVKKPPHILVTTPESLYLLLTSEKGRVALKSVDTLIVDEIHALVRDKRGSHLSLSIERLAALTQRPLQRIGLSATQKPIERMAEFLVGSPGEPGGVSPRVLEESSPRRHGDTEKREEEKKREESGIGAVAKKRKAAATKEPARKSKAKTALAIESTHPLTTNSPSTLSASPLLSVSPCLRGEPSSAEARRASPSANHCSIIDVGHVRELDLAIEVPPSDLSAVCSHEQWAEVNQRLVELINSHRSTLIFVNTRRMAERVTFQLTQLLGEDQVGSHHGSLAADIRLDTEKRLKYGQIKAVVATASLELGIDVGYIDLVIQLGSPRSIATFLQRIGRSGHALGLIPKGRLFAMTRDELLECMALMRAIRHKRLDAIPIPEAPLDILAQQIVAEVAAQDWSTDELFALARRAMPYRDVTREQFDRIIEILSEGVAPASGRARAYVHHDQVNRRVTARKGARLMALSNGGAIAEQDSIRVIVEPEHVVVGSVDEEFGVESSAGDIFLLGNTSWRIKGLRGNDLMVTDAQGAPPTIPFWRGEAPGRTVELSEEVSRLRKDIEERLAGNSTERAGSVSARSLGEEDSPRRHGDTEKREGENVLADGLARRAPELCDDVDTETRAGSISARSLGEEDSPRTHGDTEKREGENVLADGLARRAPEWDVDVDTETRAGSVSARSLDESDADLRALTLPARSLNPFPAIASWLADETLATEAATSQIVLYIAAEQAAIGLVPLQEQVVFERFFDESGGMQLVVHAPFGSRVNRAWGLAMRKRFCRSFDFELQATADDEGFILSLGPQHSFPIESLFNMLRTDNAKNLLEQAILAVPMFQLRWRWNATRALQVQRSKNGKKVPPALQRFRSDDLLTAVFPKLTGCQENIVGDHEIPDHPLVQQTMLDCLHEALDVNGLLDVLARIERGEITLSARDTREPSPFAYELLNANPYAFLDGGEVQERRARAVQTRRSLSVDSVRDLGRLDPAAIEQVVAEAQPQVRSADELHDMLLSRCLWPVDPIQADVWQSWFKTLVRDGRAAVVEWEEEDSPRSHGDTELREGETREQEAELAAGLARRAPDAPPSNGHAKKTRRASPAAKSTSASPLSPSPLLSVSPWLRGESSLRSAWVPAERWPVVRAMFPNAVATPTLVVPESVRFAGDEIEARVLVVRGLIEVSGPITGSEIADQIGITVAQADAALEALEGEGIVLRGRFRGKDLGSRSLDLGSKKTIEPDSQILSPNSFSSSSPNSQLLTPNSSPPPIDDDARPRVAPAPTTEWCHRRLLARIHRLTLAGLRREIEPVEVATFTRFLFRYHSLLPGKRRQGANGLFEVIGQLQGLDLPAMIWENDVLAKRVEGYDRRWLDELCLTGEVGWGRLYPPARDPEKSRPMASLTRIAPIGLFLRGDIGWLSERAPTPAIESLSSPAAEVLELFESRGALFSSDILTHTRLLPTELDQVLGELVTRGFVSADGFAGLRTLIKDAKTLRREESRAPQLVQRRRGTTAGRWTLWREGGKDLGVRNLDLGREENGNSAVNNNYASASALPKSKTPNPKSPATSSPSTINHQPSTTSWAWQLLRRWGIVFRDLLIKEPGAPAWWELLQVYRKLEARGEIRGGRFVKGVAGEQFTLGDTLRQLREIKPVAGEQEIVVLSAADPLNIIGVLTPHSRIPSTAHNKIAYLNGIPAAQVIGGELSMLLECDRETATRITAACGLSHASEGSKPQSQLAIPSAK